MRAIMRAVRGVVGLPSILLFAVLGAGISPARAGDGIGTPLVATLGTAVLIDPSEGLAPSYGQNLRAEWSWENRPSGSSASFTDAALYRPTFTPDVAGTYEALATFYDVADTGSTTPLHTVHVEIGTGNLTPVARIGTRGLPNGSSPLVLDGSASFDVNGDALTYAWTIESAPSGSRPSFADQTSPITDLRMDSDGFYTVGLQVTDPASAVSTKTTYEIKFVSTGGDTSVFRHVFDQALTAEPNSSQTFDFGDVAAADPLDVSISGFRFDVSGEAHPDTVEFTLGGTTYTVTTPQDFLDLTAALAALGSPDTLVRISPDPAGTDATIVYGYGLGSLTLKGVVGPVIGRQDLIDEGAGWYLGTGAHHVAPVASTRFPQFPATVSQTLRLDPYATTDLEGEEVYAEWSLAVAPAGSSASLGWAPDNIAPLTPPDPGDYLVALKAQDWLFSGYTRALIVAGSAPEIMPVARITPVRVAATGSPLKLDGTQSYDLDGDLLTWHWSLLSRPAGSTAAVASPTAPYAAISPDVAGLYVVQLQVTGGGQTSVPTTQAILVDAPYPVAEAGRDALPDASFQASLDGAASGPALTHQMWTSAGIAQPGETASFADPMTLQTLATLPPRQGLFIETIKTKPVYFNQRSPIDPGYCEYDTRIPPDIPGASPSEPISITLTAQGQIWGPIGLMQAWQVENQGDYTRTVLFHNANGATYGSYPVPGKTSIFVATPDTDTRLLTIEVGGTGVATGYASASPFSNGNLVCAGPGSAVVQLNVQNASGYALPSTIFLGNTDLRPVLTRPSDFVGTPGAAVTLVGTNYSYDANGTALAYSWALISRPSGSAATLTGAPAGTILTAPQAVLTPDVQGFYLVQLTARDAEYMSEPMTIVIEAGQAPNQPPVLEPLDPLYSVEAGLTLSVQLEGSDPDGNPISYFIRPLPLPAGFSLDAETGQISVSPGVAQIGTHVFTVGVSDGALTDTATFTVEVTTPSAVTTGLSGVVRDAVTNAPLAGIPVRLQTAGASTSTDVNGVFSFSGLTAGNDVVLVEPSASGGPGGYASATRPVQIIGNQIRPLAPDFRLTPLSDGCATVVAGNATVLTGTSNGVTVTIPADTIKTGAGAAYSGSVCLGTLPQLFAAEGLPAGTEMCQIYALDAPGAVFTEGMSVTAPNVDSLPANTVLNFWQVNPNNGLFRPAAAAGVDAGGLTVSTATQSFRAGTLFAFLPAAPKISAATDQPTGNYDYSVFDGNMSETYRLPAYRAFNRAQQVGLTYNSRTANPHPVIAGNIEIGATASLPVGLSGRIELGGLSIASDAVWTPREGLDGSTPALVGEAVALRQSLPLDAVGLPSGRYDYSFVSRSKYDCSTVGATLAGQLYIQNEVESPVGKGWSVEGLQNLVVGTDGRVSIFDDGGIVAFDPQPTLTEFEPEPLTFPATGPTDVSTLDYTGDGQLDVAWPDSGTGAVRLLRNLGDRTFGFDSAYVVGTANAVPPTGTFFPNLLAVAPGELTGDGLPDIAYGLQLQNGYGYLENDGFGGFSNEVLVIGGSASASPKDMTVVDLDGDGYQDIVFGSFTGGIFGNDEIWVSWGGATSRTLQRISLVPFGNVPLQLVVTDVDGNGRLDVAYRTTQSPIFLFQTGHRSWSRQAPAIGTAGINLLGKYFALADFNGDGKQDVVWSGTDNLTVYMNANTTGRTFITPGTALARPTGATTAMFIFVADANGDGRDDIVTSYADSIAVYLSNGDGTFQPFEEGLLNYGANEMTLADMDGDGSLDVVTAQRFTVKIQFSKPSASGKFVARAGEFSTLSRLPDGTYQRRYKDGNTVVFDTDGRQTALVDPQGNRKEYAYDASGRLSTITDQVGGVTTFTYGPLGRLASIAYPDGRLTEFTYDDQGTLAQVEEPTGSTVSFAYDNNGRLVSTTNQNGNTSNYSYDATGQLQGSTLPDGATIRNQVAVSLGLVDGLGGAATSPLKYVKPEDRFTTVTDRKGGKTEIEVNQFGSIVKTTDPLGRVTTTERDSSNLVTAVVRPNDSLPGGTRRDTLSYDTLGNVLSLTEASGAALQRVKSFEYEPVFSKVTKATDFGGFDTDYEYDATGLLTKSTDAEGGVRLFTYEANGLMATRIDENGNETGFDYDAKGNLSQIAYDDGSLTALSYDTAGNPVLVSEADGSPIERQVHSTFDAMGRTLTMAVTGADGIVHHGTLSYAYDPVGNVTSSTDQTGVQTTADYDDLERLVEVVDPIDGTLRRTFNLFGEMASYTNGAGETTSYTYDAVSRLTLATDAENYQRSVIYDSRNNIVSVTDARSGVTAFTFDGLNRVVGRTNPLDLTIARSYDSRDNLVSLTREDGSVETASYDDLSRRIGIVAPDNTLSYSYDAFGNLTEAADNDSRITFQYDERNRLDTATTDGTVGPQPAVTLSYAYDLLGRRTSMTDSLGGTTSYSWNDQDWLTGLTAPWGNSFAFTYDNAGRRTGLTSSAGRVTTMAYANGLLTALTHAQGATTLLDQTFQYTADGQIQAITDALDPTKSLAYSYDALNRLTGVGEGTPAAPVETYSYDGEGNRLSSQFSASYTSNANNQLTEDDTYTYAYDERGNRIGRTAKVGGAEETYSYDSQNRLIEYSDGTTSVAYAYDALDRRIAKVTGPDTEAYVLDAWSLGDTASSDRVADFDNGALTQRWVFGPQVDEPLGYEAYSGSTSPGAGTAFELLADRLGSVRTVVASASGSVAASYRYDSYGNRQVTGSAVQPYGFTGREHDNESGLIYLRARQYDPATGVFMQSDPIGLASAETNLHTYVRNNPTNWTDPTGLMATIECQTGSQSGGACGSMAGLTSPILNSTSMLAMAIAMEIANMSNEEWRKNGTPPPSGHNSGGQEPPEPPQPPIPFIPYIPDRSNDPSFNPPTTAGPDQWDAPTNLFTQLAWLDVLLGGGVGRPLNLNNDPIFHASNGWQKMHYTRTSSSGESVTFHYQYNSRTGQIADIKIIGYSPPN